TRATTISKWSCSAICAMPSRSGGWMSAPRCACWPRIATRSSGGARWWKRKASRKRSIRSTASSTRCASGARPMRRSWPRRQPGRNPAKRPAKTARRRPAKTLRRRRPMARSNRAELLLKMKPEERRAELDRLRPRQRASLKRHWQLWAHAGQMPPPQGWHSWLIMAGRGYGKTRAGAEWVRAIAEDNPAARIALIGASLGEARRVMVEGPSGLLAIAPPRSRPVYEPSKRQLRWPNGALATLYSAAEPESLRGPQHSHAWCDEIAKWVQTSGKAEAAWDNMLLGLRLGA